jgi:hypothetical protein
MSITSQTAPHTKKMHTHTHTQLVGWHSVVTIVTHYRVGGPWI